MPDGDSDFSDLNKLISSTPEEVKIEQLNKQWEKIINNKIDQVESSFTTKYEEKTKEIERNSIKKIDEECEKIINRYNKTNTISWAIAFALVTLLLAVLGFFAKYYISSTNDKFKDYQTFCEKIVDEKIQNKLLIKQK